MVSSPRAGVNSIEETSREVARPRRKLSVRDVRVLALSLLCFHAKDQTVEPSDDSVALLRLKEETRGDGGGGDFFRRSLEKLKPGEAEEDLMFARSMLLSQFLREL